MPSSCMSIQESFYIPRLTRKKKVIRAQKRVITVKTTNPLLTEPNHSILCLRLCGEPKTPGVYQNNATKTRDGTPPPARNYRQAIDSLWTLFLRSESSFSLISLDVVEFYPFPSSFAKFTRYNILIVVWLFVYCFQYVTLGASRVSVPLMCKHWV